LERFEALLHTSPGKYSVNLQLTVIFQSIPLALTVLVSSFFVRQQPSQFCSFVRLSVCLSYGWISRKWCKLGSPDFHHQLPGTGRLIVSGFVKFFH